MVFPRNIEGGGIVTVEEATPVTAGVADVADVHKKMINRLRTRIINFVT